MARLDIRLLGGFEVSAFGRAVTEFESDSARALLARLAVEPGRRFSRSSLAELMWPDRPAGAALGNLRHTLTVIRRAIGDDTADRPFLRVSATEIAADAGADVWVDVLELERVAAVGGSAPSVEEMQRAADLYRGELLGSLELSASDEWDDWLRTSRDAVTRHVSGMLRSLAELRERTGEVDEAERWVRRWLEIAPLDERAHRQLMRLLATGGESAAVAAHASWLIKRLRTDLGVEPHRDTVALAEQIRCGRFPGRSPLLPIALFPDRSSPPVHPAFVDREVEIGWLDRQLDDALAGNGRVALIAGAAGTGKSMLMHEFAARATHRMPRLVVVRGRCNAYTGAGDPYLPFRQILGSLCGDLEHDWASGSLTVTEATAAWNVVPSAVDAVLDEGPYLLGGFLDTDALSARVELGIPGSATAQRVQVACGRDVLGAADPARQQRPVLEQYVRVVRRIASAAPLLLLIDDMQWADTGTIELMWHLARELPGSTAILVAAYRPEEVAVAERGSVHPLSSLLLDVQARDPGATLRLGDSRAFVDAWLDTAPNSFDETFRDRLFAMTGGHPLFTVEMIRGMRDRGELAVDTQGRWGPAANLDWDTLPPRVEAVIAARVSAMPPETRDDLEVASVQGETFAPVLIADVRDVPAAVVAQRLGRLAMSDEPLVVSERPLVVGGVPIERYRFRHALFQRFLYRGLAAPERTALHAATGGALEARSGELDEVAVELAHHFDEAGVVDRAVEYHGRAGRRAMALSATTAAIVHLQRALELVDARDAGGRGGAPDEGGRTLTLLTALGSCLQARFGYTAPQTDAVYERIRSLAAEEGATIEAVQALGAVVTVDMLRARYREAASGTEQLLGIARETGVPLIEAVAHMQAGLAQLMTGYPVEAERHLRRAHELYDPAADGWVTSVVGQDVGATALAWWAVALWELGYPDQARRRGDEAIELARQSGHPFSLAFALAIGGSLVSFLRGEPADVLAVVDEVAELADREDFAFYRAAASVHRGLGLGLTGDLAGGLAELDRGLAGWRALGTEAFITWVGTSRVDLLLRAGRVDEADAALDGLEVALATFGEGIAISQWWLERGRVQLARGDALGAERSFRRALAVAHERGQHGPALQIASALARLLQDEGRDGEAQALLQPVVDRFEEGHDTGDWCTAASLLT